MRCNDNAGNRKTITHSFCHRIDVCIYACKIMTKEFPAPAITTLYAVSDINGSVLITKRSYFPEESIVGYMDAAYALYSFYDNGRDLLSIFFKAIFQRLFI